MVWIYHYLYSDPTGQLQTDIKELIAIRKGQNIHASSEVSAIETINGASGYYHAVIDNTLKVVIGSGRPEIDETIWEELKSGDNYTLWQKR